MGLSRLSTGFVAAVAAVGAAISPAVAGDGKITGWDVREKLPTYSEQIAKDIEALSITNSMKEGSDMVITAYGPSDTRIRELQGVANYIEKNAPFEVAILIAPSIEENMTQIAIHFEGSNLLKENLNFGSEVTKNELQRSTVIAAQNGYQRYKTAKSELAALDNQNDATLN